MLKKHAHFYFSLLRVSLRDANPFNAISTLIILKKPGFVNHMPRCKRRFFSVMHDILRRADPCDGVLSRFPAQIHVRRFGNKRFNGFHPPVMDKLADM